MNRCFLAVSLIAAICTNFACALPPCDSGLEIQTDAEYIPGSNLDNVLQKSNCGCSEQKAKVFLQRQPPIVIDRKAQSVVVPAPAPIYVKPAPVIIHRPAPVEVRPIVIKHQPKPLIVKKKIVQVSRPIIKKYFVEQYSKQEDCPCKDQTVNVEQQTVDLQAQPSTCSCTKCQGGAQYLI